MADATQARVNEFLLARGERPSGNYRADANRARGLQAGDQAYQSNPEVKRLVDSGGSGTVKNAFGDADIVVQDGKLVGANFGGWVKPLLAAGTVLGGGAGLAALGLGAGGAAALGPVAAGGGTTAAAVPGALGAAGGSGLFGGLASNAPGLLRAGAGMLGAAGQAAAQNRGSAAELALAGDGMTLANDQNRRADESQAWKQLQQAAYVKDWQPRTPSNPNLPTYGFGPVAPTDTERQGAATLEAEMLRRLDPANRTKLSDLSQYASPSGTEKAANWLAPGLGFASLLFNR